MSRELDTKIARWLGERVVTVSGAVDRFVGWTGLPIPCYSTSDSDAITLLPILVEQGYQVALMHVGDGWNFAAYDQLEKGSEFHQLPTIAQAICAAVSELIDKENN